MIDVKIAFDSPKPTKAPPFPSQTLIITNIASCFLSTAALCLSFVQLGTRHSMIVIPNTIGFLLTTPFHAYLYVCAQRHLEVKRNTPHLDNIEVVLTPYRIVVIFLLVTGWVLILLVNILFSLKAAVGAILTTLMGGLELFTLFFLAIKSSHEYWAAEAPDAEDQRYRSGMKVNKPLPMKLRIMYLVSFVLSTVCLVVSVGSPSFLANIFAFVATVPYHLTIFIESGKPQLATTAHPSQTKSIILSFVLVGVWGFAFILSLMGDSILFQRIVSSVFGGIQSIVIGYLAVQGVLDTLNSGGQVKLP